MTLISLVLISCASSNDYLVDYNRQASAKKNEQLVLKNEMLASIERHGSPWIYIGKSIDGIQLYINGRSIEGFSESSVPLRYKSGNLEFASKYVRVAWKAIQKDGSSIQLQSYMYCKNQAMKYIGITHYSSKLEFLYSEDLGDYVTTITPDSVAEQIFNFACEIAG